MQGILKPFEVRDRRVKEKFDMDDAYLNGWARKCGVYSTAVYNSLCRHANKEQYCWPSQKKIAEEHNISIRQVRRALSVLQKYRIVIEEREGKKLNNRYWLTDKSEWTNSPITADSQSDHQRTNSPIHSKVTQYKDTHSKEATADAVAGKEIAEIIDLFKEVNPSYGILFKNKTQRESAARLLKGYKKEKLTALIAALPDIIKQPYAPRITTPYELEMRMGGLKAFIDQYKEIRIKKGIQSL